MDEASYYSQFIGDSEHIFRIRLEDEDTYTQSIPFYSFQEALNEARRDWNKTGKYHMTIVELADGDSLRVLNVYNV